MRLRTTATAIVIALVGTAGSLVAPRVSISAPATTQSFSKIMIVVLENTDYDDALEQPFLASLAKRGMLLTNFTAETHPSQPNYIALVSGSTYDVTSDAN